MKSTTVGIDLAKQVFATCTLDDKGTVIARKELQRDALPGWLAVALTTGAGSVRLRGSSPG